MSRPTVEKRIILIAQLRKHRLKYLISDDDLEFTDQKTFEDISTALRRISNDNFIHYSSPKEFIRKIDSHKEDIVISMWSGRKSRNRRSLIPAICEANDINYVGPDAYTFSLSQDKYLSKVFCKEQGLKMSRSILIENLESIEQIRTLRLPIVVKPNFQGGSIGISNENLVANYDDAIKLGEELYKYFHESILFEEFIPGQEVSLVLFGQNNELKIIEAVKLVVDGKDDFQNTIYGFETKKEKKSTLTYDRVTSQIDHSTLRACESIFNYLGKVEVMRIDGRIQNGEFKMIELTPDAYLGVNCFVQQAFLWNNYSHDEMLQEIIKNSIDQFQNAKV